MFLLPMSMKKENQRKDEVDLKNLLREILIGVNFII